MKFLTGAGRIGRLNYLGLYLLIVLVMIVGVLASISTDELTGQTQASPLFLIVAILGIWTANANVVRRLHDCGHSGWLALLGLVPIVSIGLGFYLLFTAGDSGTNRYGPPPGQAPQLAPQHQRQRMQQITAAAAEAYSADQRTSVG